MEKRMDRIEELAHELSEEIGCLDDNEKVEALNHARRCLHEVSPFRDEPCDCIQWVRQEDVHANEYNPNHVAGPEMRLLYESIKLDGYTMPIVTYDLGDGTRRSWTGSTETELEGSMQTSETGCMNISPCQR